MTETPRARMTARPRGAFMNLAINDGPICAYCRRGTDEKRLVSVYVRMR